MHEIWIEQCDAAQDIKLRYGLKAAFDYVVAEKVIELRQCWRRPSGIRARAASVCFADKEHVYTAGDPDAPRSD